MRRVYWTLDFFDAQIVANLLRAHDIPAHLFDAGIVRQDWLGALAYGGYRLVVDADHVASAEALLKARNRGQLALPSLEGEQARCPSCASTDSESDSARRRWGFLALYFLPLALPLIAVKSRYRCRACGHRWKAPRESHAALDAQVEAATAG